MSHKYTSDLRFALAVAHAIDSASLREDARAILEAFESARDEKDFTVETSEGEYRIISHDVIESIHREEIEQLVDECYDLDKARKTMGNVGQYLTFDYDAFAYACRINDGYGLHFSGYDGEELETKNNSIFRIS